MLELLHTAFWIALAACGVAELAIGRLVLGPRSPWDRRSLTLLGIVQAGGIASVALTTAWAPETFCRLIGGGMGNGLGSAIAIAGLAIRLHAKRTLGRFFTARVTILPEHQLIQRGLYRRIRHPSYLGILLFFLGWLLLVGHLWGFLVLWIPTLLAYLYRIKVEEEALGAAFGEAYRRYQQKTARLVPFLW